MEETQDSSGTNGKWTAAAKRLQADIDAGRWKAGEKLPPSAWLCSHLGLTQPTLRKVMRLLSDDGVVEALVRGWRVSPPPERVRGLRVALIRHCDRNGVQVGEAEREMFFRRALEQEASRTGMRIEAFGFSDEGELFRDGEPFQKDLSSVLDGVILSLWRMEKPELAFGRLATLRMPVAIWDERPQGGRRAVLHRSRWFTSGYSDNAGVKAGQHLVDLGHRGIAYLSPYHASEWSRSRWEGLSQACSKKSVVLERFVHGDRWDPAQFEPDPCEVAKLVAGLESQVWPSFARRVAGVAHSMAAILRDRDVLTDLDSLFARALADTRLTAWVAANDDIALLAWSWLVEKGVKVGQDLSLVGFDNTLRSQEWGLSSVGFGEEELAVAVLGFLADPKRWRSGELVQMDCALVARRSTAKPSVAN